MTEQGFKLAKYCCVCEELTDKNDMFICTKCGEHFCAQCGAWEGGENVLCLSCVMSAVENVTGAVGVG